MAEEQIPVKIKVGATKHAYSDGTDHIRILIDSSRAIIEKAKTKPGEMPRVIEPIATYTSPEAKPKEKPKIKHLANMSDPIDMISNKDKKHDPPKNIKHQFNPNYLGSYDNNVIDSKSPSKAQKRNQKTRRR